MRLALWSLVVAIAITGCSGDEPAGQFGHPSVPQSTDRRTMRPLAVELGDTLEVPGTTMGTPSQVVFDANYNVYVLDRGNSLIYVFDRNGTFVRQIGRGFGAGPGEFDRPSGLAVSATGVVVVAEEVGRTLSVFDTSDFVGSIALPFAPLQIAFLSDTTLVASNFFAKHLFTEVSVTGRTVSGIGTLYEEPHKYSIVSVGRFLVDRDSGRIILQRTHTGAILSFGRDGLEYAREPIEGSQEVAVRIIDGGIRQLDGERRGDRLFRIVAVGSGEILTATTFIKQNPLKIIYDVYDVTTGAYKYSFDNPLPFPCALTQAYSREGAFARCGASVVSVEL